MGAACSTYGVERCVHGFGGEPEAQRSRARPWHRWDDNIKIVLQEVGCDGMDWIELAQDRDSSRVIVNTVMNLWVPLNSRNLLTS
jgi:hypothetical protein